MHSHVPDADGEGARLQPWITAGVTSEIGEVLLHVLAEFAVEILR